VRERLRVYESTTTSLIGFYANRGILRRVSAAGDPDRVWGRRPADRWARDLCHGTPYRPVREPRVRIDTTCAELPATPVPA